MKLMRAILIAVVMLSSLPMNSQVAVEYEATVMGNGSTGEFAPFYIASNNHGIMPQKNAALVRGAVGRDLDLSRRC